VTMRRASLPGAAELFRTTVPASPPPLTDERLRRTGEQTRPRGSGRQKHDAKITVYVSGEELLALEQARLSLRAEFGLAVDRGRIVREAVAVLLADLQANGPDSLLVRQLRQDADA